ncbi:F0F1 ATP synthase subunit A [Actinomycetaceae bacterium TAE3-ERU4]|nr:F0F1 ATP synthase subunit A [Actinomycetaceae bacterium TAE3-ERU4]
MPGLADFFPEPFLFVGTPFAVNRITLTRLVAVFALVLIFSLGASRMKLVPGRLQGFLEMCLEFIRDQVVGSIIDSPRLAKMYTPALTVIFLGVFAMNITGVVPLLHIAGSSVIGVPLVFAIYSYFLFIIAGIKEQGVGHFLKNQLFPPGLPKVVYLMITPIEFFSTFIIRPATLVIRLLANMVAGHILLALTFFATHFLFFYAANYLKIFGVFTFLGSLAAILLEIMVAVLQAFVFSALTAVYIQLSVSEH